MKHTFSFYNGSKFIGFLILENLEDVERVANQIGASDFENDDTNTYYYKCSFCGEWFEESELKNSLCSYCQQEMKSRGEE